MKRFLIVALCAMFVAVTAAQAEDIGSVKTSGLVFKDTLSVRAIDDPDYPWVVCYTTDIEIGGPNIENPTDNSIACRLVGEPPKFVEKDGVKVPFEYRSSKRVFRNTKNPFFKTMYVDRFYDKKRNVLVYLSYVRKLSGTNASHSLSVVPLGMPLKP